MRLSGLDLSAAYIDEARRHMQGLRPAELVTANAEHMPIPDASQDIVVSIALKPTSSIQVPGSTVNLAGEPVEVVTTGRHDPCVGLRATPIAEAMLALVLMDHYLRHRGQNADVVSTTPVLPAGP